MIWGVFNENGLIKQFNNKENADRCAEDKNKAFQTCGFSVSPLPEKHEDLIHIIALKENRIYDLVKENERLKIENQSVLEELLYENKKMRDYIKNYGITHGEIK